MSRGISWQQRSMLEQLDRLNSPNPVPWRQLVYGSGDEEDFNDIAVRERREQAQQRALRNLEKRGLVTQDKWSYTLIDNEWVNHPDDHVPRWSRYMLGVELTEEGRRVARQRPRRRRTR